MRIKLLWLRLMRDVVRLRMIRNLLRLMKIKLLRLMRRKMLRLMRMKRLRLKLKLVQRM